VNWHSFEVKQLCLEPAYLCPPSAGLQVFCEDSTAVNKIR